MGNFPKNMTGLQECRREVDEMMHSGADLALETVRRFIEERIASMRTILERELKAVKQNQPPAVFGSPQAVQEYTDWLNAREREMPLDEERPPPSMAEMCREMASLETKIEQMRRENYCGSSSRREKRDIALMWSKLDHLTNRMKNLYWRGADWQ